MNRQDTFTRIKLIQWGKKALPWTLLLLFTVWWFRPFDIFRQLPGYGDILEVLWASDYFVAGAKAGDLESYFFHPLTFWPEGWRVGTFADGLGAILPLMPFRLGGGNVFAHNAVLILTVFVAFTGMFKLARRFASPTAALVAALAFTFWDFRYLWHLQIFIGTALLPWIIWLIERGLEEEWGQKRHFILAGLLWAAAVSASLYFTWLGALVVVGWLSGHYIADREGRGRILTAGLYTGLTALIFSAPSILLFLRGSAMAQSAQFNIEALNSFGASLNTIALPMTSHPLVGRYLASGYSQPLNEGDLANLGLVSVLLAAVGAWHARKTRSHYFWPLFLVTLLGVLFALGPFLKWNGRPITWAPIEFLNDFIWDVGHWIKPQLFPAAEPPSNLAHAFPGPHIIPAIVLPFFDGVRTTARFLLAGGFGLYLLAALGLDRFSNSWLRLGLFLLVLIEVLPDPIRNVPTPYGEPLHPAYSFLKSQSGGDFAVAELWAPAPDRLTLWIGPHPLWASQFHQTPTLSGGGSVIPGHTIFLNYWLATHKSPSEDPEFRPLMEAFSVRYLLLYMLGPNEESFLLEAKNSGQLNFIDCFEPHDLGQRVWGQPICVLELREHPPSFLGADLVLGSGWGELEPWGIWGIGESSTIRFIATNGRDHRLQFTASPYCEALGPQRMEISLNGRKIAAQDWNDCTDLVLDIELPGELIELGWNEILFEFDAATSPAEATGGVNPDRRPLAVGFKQLRIERP